MSEQHASTLDADLLIVGGGMIGLTVARAVAGAGLTSIVVDREAPAAALAAAADGRASALAAGSVRLLQDIGVWQGMEAEAQPILEIRVSDGDSPLFLHYDHADLGEEPFGYMVENRVTRQALQEGIEAAVVGNRIGDVSAAIQTYVEGKGFEVVRQLVGHGVGFAVHESPQVPNFGEPGTGEKIKEGLVIALEPMVTIGDPMVETAEDGWSVRVKTGELTAHFEHTVAVTKKGPVILTD